jgi:transposase
MKLMAGMDLHSNNVFCGIVNQDGKRLFEKKLPCDLKSILNVMKPYKDRLDTLAVESTYNWYWLVDGLQDAGYNVVLANPAQIDQYNGIKQTDDKSDAFFLAELLRLNILPVCHIYDRRTRPVRDMLRRRMSLVQKRTSVILSLKSLYTRNTGEDLALARVKAMDSSEVEKLFEHPCDQMISKIQMDLIAQLEKSIGLIEKSVIEVVTLLPCYSKLQTIPGIGRILALTITLETGNVERFLGAGNFASYCRCVGTKRLSNGKQKGSNNGKCGNKYLAWAFVEAANFARRYCETCRQFYDRKAARTNKIVATKSLACKLAKAAWHIMKEETTFKLERIFPGTAKKHSTETPLKIITTKSNGPKPPVGKPPGPPVPTGGRVRDALRPAELRAVARKPAPPLAACGNGTADDAKGRSKTEQNMRN